MNEKLNLIEQSLLELLKKCNEGDFIIVKRNLATIRTIQETTLQCLHWVNRDMLPKEPYDDNGNIIFKVLMKHISICETKGRKDYPDVIKLMIFPLYLLASIDGAHVPNETSSYPPTKYTVQILTFALLDFLKWFGIILTKYQEEKG